MIKKISEAAVADLPWFICYINKPKSISLYIETDTYLKLLIQSIEVEAIEKSINIGDDESSSSESILSFKKVIVLETVLLM